MRVRLLVPRTTAGEYHPGGTILDIEAGAARRMVEAGIAEPAGDELPERATQDTERRVAMTDTDTTKRGPDVS